MGYRVVGPLTYKALQHKLAELLPLFLRVAQVKTTFSGKFGGVDKAGAPANMDVQHLAVPCWLLTGTCVVL